MNGAEAIGLLSIIITSLGILIGFLLLFIQFITERKRRVMDIYLSKLIDKTVDSPSKLTIEEKLVKTVHDAIGKKNIEIQILGKNCSLIAINMALFLYTLSLFIASFTYVSLIICCNKTIYNELIYTIIILTVIDYLLLFPIAYLSCVKDYELK